MHSGVRPSCEEGVDRRSKGKQTLGLGSRAVIGDNATDGIGSVEPCSWVGAGVESGGDTRSSKAGSAADLRDDTTQSIWEESLGRNRQSKRHKNLLSGPHEDGQGRAG